jgi:hypothetical protein
MSLCRRRRRRHGRLYARAKAAGAEIVMEIEDQDSLFLPRSRWPFVEFRHLRPLGLARGRRPAFRDCCCRLS